MITRKPGKDREREGHLRSCDWNTYWNCRQPVEIAFLLLGPLMTALCIAILSSMRFKTLLGLKAKFPSTVFNPCTKKPAGLHGKIFLDVAIYPQ